MVGISGVVADYADEVDLSGMTALGRGDESFVEVLENCQLVGTDLASGRNFSSVAVDGERLWLWGNVYGQVLEEGYRRRPRDASPAEYVRSFLQEHSVNQLGQLNGDFLVVRYDDRSQRLQLVTDRLGSRPVYITRKGDAVYFSTSMIGLASHESLDARFDEAALSEYFAFSKVYGTKTPFEGLECAPPSSVVDLDATTLEIRSESYWEPVRNPIDRPYSYFIDRFVETFERAVRERTAEEGRYGLLLSGGADSRLLLGTCQDRVTCFTWGGPGSPPVKIARQIEEVSHHDHRWLSISEREMFESVAHCYEYVGWYRQAKPTQFVNVFREECDVVLSAFLFDTLFKGWPLTKRETLGPISRSVREFESVDHYVERIDDYAKFRGIHSWMTHDFGDIQEIVRDEIQVTDDGIEHHGVRYPTGSELLSMAEWYPLTNQIHFLNRSALNQTVAHRNPILDVRLIDLQLQYPLEYQINKNIVSSALKRIAPELGRIPHESTGVRATYPRWVHNLSRLLPFDFTLDDESDPTTDFDLGQVVADHLDELGEIPGIDPSALSQQSVRELTVAEKEPLATIIAATQGLR